MESIEIKIDYVGTDHDTRTYVDIIPPVEMPNTSECNIHQLINHILTPTHSDVHCRMYLGCITCGFPCSNLY